MVFPSVVDFSLTLPGVVFSVSRSRYTLPVQLAFLLLNGLGLVFGTIYNVSTPDLYENNAHHTVGWVATWVVTVQVIISMLFLYSGRTEKNRISSDERGAFIPIANTEGTMSPYRDYRWSGDSGHGSETSLRSASPTDPRRLSRPEPELEDVEEDSEGLLVPVPPSQPPSRFRIRVVDRFLSASVPGLFSTRLLKTADLAYDIIDWTILILGFVALMSGGVVYAGIFVSAPVLWYRSTREANIQPARKKHIQWHGTLL